MSTTTVNSGEIIDESVPKETAFDIGERLDELEKQAFTLDAAFRVPFTNFRIGIDPIVSVVPGFGDGLMMLASFYILYKGARMGASSRTLFKMLRNLVAEVVIGLAPIMGDIIDILWSMNMQNVGYLREESDSLDGTTNLAFMGVILATPVMMVVVLFAIVSSIFSFITGLIP